MFHLMVYFNRKISRITQSHIIDISVVWFAYFEFEISGGCIGADPNRNFDFHYSGKYLDL